MMGWWCSQLGGSDDSGMIGCAADGWWLAWVWSAPMYCGWWPSPIFYDIADIDKCHVMRWRMVLDKESSKNPDTVTSVLYIYIHGRPRQCVCI